MTTNQVLALAIVTAARKEKATIEAGLTTGEAAISTFFHGALDKLNAGGLAGVAISLIRPAVEAELDGLVNQYGPDILYGIILSDLEAWATGLGVVLPPA